MARRKPIPFYLLLILLLSGVISSCVDDPPPTPELKLGQPTELASFDVPVIGSITPITYNNKTIKVIVPANSFTTVKTIRLLRTPISSQTFGDKISPVTDLLTIDFGSDYPAHNIIVQIPTDDGKLDFTMGFYYDKVTKDLDAIPLCTPELDYTRIALRHSGDFFLSTIPLAKLYGGYETNFSISTDGSDIPNYGTSFTPTGQFAGTTLSTYWYYFEKARRGETHLYGRFNSVLDSANELWQDNTTGIFVTTEAENAIQWAANSQSLHEELVSSWNEVTVHELTYAMMVTGKPQLMSIRESNKSASLPVTVYKLVDSNAFIYDPNFPKSGNQKFSLKQLGGARYMSGNSLNDIQNSKEKYYLVYTFLGGKALQNWDALSTAYDKALKDSIPSVGYTINAGKYGVTPTKDGWGVFADSVSLTLANPKDTLTELYSNGKFTPYMSGASLHLSAGANKLGLLSQTKTKGGYPVWNGFSFFTIHKQAFSITTASHVSMVENDVVLHSFFLKSPENPIQYSWDMGDGSTVIQNTNVDSIVYRYKTPGSYVITLRVFDLATNSLLGSETTTIDITFNPVAITPKLIHAPSNFNLKFTPTITIPSDINIRSEWDFGDGSPITISKGLDTAVHKFTKEGTFIIHLIVFDTKNNSVLGSRIDTSTITGLFNLQDLQSMKNVSIRFIGDFSVGTSFGKFDFGGGPLTWLTYSFSMSAGSSKSNSWSDSANYYSHSDYESYSNFCQGNISDDFLTVTNFQCGYSHHTDFTTHDHSLNNFGASDDTRKLEGINIPIKSIYPDSILYEVSGPQTKDFLKNIYYKYSYYQTHGPSGEDEYVSTNWNSSTILPRLIIKLAK